MPYVGKAMDRKRNARRRQLSGAHTAVAWNAAHPVGTAVRYWPIYPPICELVTAAYMMGVDPDVRSSGWALVETTSGTLRGCGTDSAPREITCDLAIEVPRIVDAAPKIANDLIRVSLVAGMWAGKCAGTVRWIGAHDWTAGTPKPIRHKRLLADLSADSIAVIARAVKMRPDEIVAYVDAACRQIANKRPVTYGRQLGEVLDAVAIARWAIANPGYVWKDNI